jgi:LysM repeat protein
MKSVLSFAAACAMSLAFSSCGNSGGGTSGPDGMGQQMGIGPFDSRGNYVEELADSPSKWRKPGGSAARVTRTESLPEVAQNDQPPLNSVPLAQAKIAAPQPTIAETRVVRTTSTSSSRSKSEEEPVVIRTRPATKPEEANGKVAKTKTKAESKTETKTKVAKAKEKPKAKEAAKVVAKAKAKPKATRYLVKSGDSLSSFASRNGTSVAAIKSANGISGTVIRPGQTLSIPKR